MPRIPYLDSTQLTAHTELVDALKKRRPHHELLNLDRILLYSEPVAIGWNALFSQLRQSLHFPDELRELIILRIALVNRAPYEFQQHYPEALKAGVSQAKIDALATWENSTVFDESTLAILSYVDAMTMRIQVSDTIFAELKKHFTHQQIIEITALCAGYNMVSRFLEALQITTDGES